MNSAGMIESTQRQLVRYPGESRDPGFRSADWIPAFAGMTAPSDAPTRNAALPASNEPLP